MRVTGKRTKVRRKGVPKIGAPSHLGKSVATFSFMNVRALFPARLPPLLMALCLLVPVGCRDVSDTDPADSRPGPAAPSAPAGAADPASESGSSGAADRAGGWEREFLMLGLGTDSTFALPWSWRAIVSADSTRWERTFRMELDGRWEMLVADSLATGPLRTPWRIVPGGPLEMVVDTDDAISALVVGTPERQVEVRPGEFLAEWNRPEGGALRLFRSSASLAGSTDPDTDREVDGLWVDLTRAWSPEGPPPADWIFLHDGTATQLFLEAVAPRETDSAQWRGWSRIAFQTRPWPELSVQWAETRAFERARRDIPQRWRIESPDGAFEGELQAEGSHLVAGSGPGPLLPVDAVFRVNGELRVEGELISVTGIVRHVQR